MDGPSYPAARIVAERLSARAAASTVYANTQDVTRPDVQTIEEIITTAFWASLRREEGRGPKISIAFLSPEQSARPVQLNPRVPLDANLLARLAPAVEKPGIHIGVWSYDGQLCTWGITRMIPKWCFILEVIGPGFLVVKYRRDDASTKFANVAVLEGSQVKFIEQQPSGMSELPPALASLWTFYASAGRSDSDNILVKIAIAMRAHGRGGSLLIVPKGSQEWHSSIVQPIAHSLVAPFPDIVTFLQRNADSNDVSPLTLQSAVDALAGLTAVDGATIISDRFEPLAFGAKILTRDAGHRVDQVLLTEPIEGVSDLVVDPALLGGTRHLSAAQFSLDQRNAIALVASQDGQFTIFAWSPLKNMVHAYRLDALLI